MSWVKTILNESKLEGSDPDNINFKFRENITMAIGSWNNFTKMTD